jgi:signal transduction histidine kinase
MFSGTDKVFLRSAAWRISFWATIAFACGTLVGFAFLHQFVSHDIQQRRDSWLFGEVQTQASIASRTPKNALYGKMLGEIAELASHEVPEKLPTSRGENNDVFFLQTAPDGSMALWVGPDDGNKYLKAIRSLKKIPEKPTDIQVDGYRIPYRVVSANVSDGSRIYLGLSERDQLRALRNLRFRFALLWLSVVLIGSAIVFYTTYRMLAHVRKITEAASRIGESDLSRRVPVPQKNDEVAQLATTLNHMLDRIESSMQQLHSITDSLAHDLRSPLTAIRAKLEMILSTGARAEEADAIVSAIEDLDRVTDFLNRSLDIAEARADALRLDRIPIDLDEILRAMIHLYEPSMSERGLRAVFHSGGPAEMSADAALMHRMVANLFDNELKHVPASSTVIISLQAVGGEVLLGVEDDGPGFAGGVLNQIFGNRVKGPNSNGHGLGLAFVEAVIHAHGGTIAASNRPEGGARLAIVLPSAAKSNA